MKISDFKKLRVIEEEKDMERLCVGDLFLYGKNISNQKENKKENDPITYFKVINITNGIEYTPIYDVLEKEN